MRLGGYILFELAVGASLLAGAGSFACFGGWELISSRLARATPSQAHAISSPPGLPPPLLPFLPVLDVEPIPATSGYFGGIQDEVLLAPLRTRNVIRAKFNRGGSSVTLRLDFEGGARAAFKPDQTNLQSIPRKEVAAYRLDRMLGLGAVAPALARAIPAAVIGAVLDPDSKDLLPRWSAEVIARGGLVGGSLAFWIPIIRDAKVDEFTIDSTDGIVTWKRYLTVGEDIPPGAARIVPQISNMLVFDFLINNSDRFSGSNTKGSADGHELYFMDNALSFHPSPGGHQKVGTYLARCQKFSRSLVNALKRISEERIRGAMNEDTGPYRTLLTDAEIRGVLARRDFIIQYVSELIRVHGEHSILVFP